MIPKPDSCKGCPLYEKPHGKALGFSYPDGDGDVLVIAEALGKEEEIMGKALVGKSGYALFQQLKRVNVEREQFTLYNTVACRPPDNKLVGMPFMQGAIDHCRQNLKAAIEGVKARLAPRGKTPVIITLGVTPFKAILGLDSKKDAKLLKKDYWGYPHWSTEYQAWVLACPHPAYLIRGNTHLWPIVQWVFQRALEISAHGMRLDEPKYELDPQPSVFDEWIKGYERSLVSNPDNPLSYDIETPYKKKTDSEDELGKEEDADHTILRISFSYWDGTSTNTVSVKWTAEFMAGIERLFDVANYVLGWNCPTPDQKILTYDLRWVPAHTLKTGDKIIGLDEQVQPGHRIRRCKSAVIKDVRKGVARVYQVEFSDGSKVKVTGEHPWLLTQRSQVGKVAGSNWVKTKDLLVGQTIQRMFKVWSEDTTKEAGYLAGFFDGEGHVSGAANGTIRVGAAQNNGVALDYVLTTLDKKGFLSKKKYAKREKDKNCCNFVIDGGIGPSAEFLGSIRPVRLLAKFKPDMLGPVWRPRQEPLKIVSVTNLGLQQIIRLSTSSKTYFLEGFAAHNSDKYDSPRVRHHVPIRGIGLDGMVAWHILNSSLPKALGFVTPFYWQNTAMWKHTDDVDPSYYNAKDADAALRCWMGIKRDLITHRLWNVYERHWIELQRALKYMTGVGVLRDEVMRSKAEGVLSSQLDTIESSMEEATPVETRAIKIYKKAPKVIAPDMYEIVKEYPIAYCSKCGVQCPSRWKKHTTLCGGTPTTLNEPFTVWAKPLPFKVSKNRMLSYQQFMKHQSILDRKEKKITFDADAITMLTKKYPGDRLYPLILNHRKAQKLLSAYVGVTDGNRIIGGMPVGKDGRIHTQYGRDASTLRFTSEEPNMQNLTRPNPGDPDDPANFIRNLIVGGDGNVLYARDYSGIEAVLTGYFALDPKYIRLAKHDVHTYYTVYALYELEGGRRISAADLPDINWPDDRLFPYLETLKSQFKKDRNSLYKHLVHAANFMQGAKGAADKIFSETGIQYPTSTVQRVMDVYYSLFPKIKQWHKNVLDEAEKDGYLRNPFDYVHRFSRVFDYKKEYGEWVRRPGTDANRVISFKPQSTAVGIITEALLRLYQNRFEEAGKHLRLQVHDELLFEIPVGEWEKVNLIVKEEMEKPVPQLKLPASWGMGSELAILTEAKVDLNSPSRWGSMRGIKDE